MTSENNNEKDMFYMRMAIDLADKNIVCSVEGGGPFGAIIVTKTGQIVGLGTNEVTKNLDPTAHAEVQSIRNACQNMRSFSLEDCTIYSSCEPCSMCLSSILWSRISRIVYGNTRHDAQNIGFDDTEIYDEVNKSNELRKIPIEQCCHDEAIITFQKWSNKTDKIHY
jgi:tRNA(Arg) A34 adenosine deaminase TadA